MPWSPTEAHAHKKGLGPSSARRWASIANRILQQTGDEGKAIRIANGMTRTAISRRLQRKAQGRYTT